MTENPAHGLAHSPMSRRTALLGLGAAFTMANARLAYAAPATAKRLVIMNVMGGLDGLNVVVPYGDPHLQALRASLIPGAPGTQGGMFDLTGYFGLHPSLPNFYQMYRDGQAMAVHAVGNAANTRSHFQDQSYIQAGASQLLATGWLNRALAFLPAQGNAVETGISMGPLPHLLSTGPTAFASWCKSSFAQLQPSSELTARLKSLLSNDALLGPSFINGMVDRSYFNSYLSGVKLPSTTQTSALAYATGLFLSQPTGPRVAVIGTSTADTHFDQNGRLPSVLQDIDESLGALKAGLGAAWNDTVVMTMTEFGRTAAVNGTAGTDHGTAFAVLLAGGAVNGGRVVTGWPGLGSTQLCQGRDLQPTVDYRGLAMGVLEEHLGIPVSAMPTVFPGMPQGIETLYGLVS